MTSDELRRRVTASRGIVPQPVRPARPRDLRVLGLLASISGVVALLAAIGAWQVFCWVAAAIHTLKSGAIL